MYSSTLASDSSDKIIRSSDPVLDLESGTNHELGKTAPGLWRVPTNTDLCCIYRVPNCLRRVSPEVYTPQSVIIGPLHHSLKLQALISHGDITNAKLMAYLNMEEHKKFYLTEFAKRLSGEKTIDGFRRVIKEDEDMIRASYLESTAWIQSREFVEIILHDSVFILEFMLRFSVIRTEKTGDPLIDEPCLAPEINRDLILLENQIPFFILEKLFDPIVSILRDKTFHELAINHFGFRDMIRRDAKFRHFTDLSRLVRVVNVPDRTFEGCYRPMYTMYNADKLDGRGIKFQAVEDPLSVLVTFNKGVLTIPSFMADDDTETTIRNIMALEQCHYPFNSHVCNYIIFLNFLIDSEKDVSLLVEEGIITNVLGNHGSVAKMVNKLCLGVLLDGSYYYKIASRVNAHYVDPYNNARTILRRVYFSNMWRGTATLVAALLLMLSLTQTVTSIIDNIKN